MDQKGAAWHRHQLCFLFLLVPRMEKHLSPLWLSKNLTLLVHPILLKGYKLLWRKKSASSWRETFQKVTGKRWCWGSVFPHQHCQGFSKYCNKEATAGGKYFFFSRAGCCAGSLQCDPEAPQHHQVNKTADWKESSKRLHVRAGDGPGIWNQTYHSEKLLWKKRDLVNPQDQYWFICAYKNIYTHPATKYLYTHQIKYIYLHVLIYGVYLYI